MKKKSPIVAVLMAALLVTVMPLSVLADVEADVILGNVSIGDTKVTHTTSDRGTVSDDHGGSVTVKQSDPSTSNTISVTTTNNNVNVTLNNVNIDTSSSGGAAGAGSNITISADAQITATGGSDANDIGGGKDGSTGRIDTTGLYTTGSINGVPGTVEPPKPVPSSPSAAPVEPVVRAASTTSNEMVFWNDIIAQIRAAKKGDTVTIDAGGVTTMPRAVMEALAECGVTLVIHWMGGEDIVIDKPITDGNIWVFSFYTLPQLLAK